MRITDAELHHTAAATLRGTPSHGVPTLLKTVGGALKIKRGRSSLIMDRDSWNLGRSVFRNPYWSFDSGLSEISVFGCLIVAGASADLRQRSEGARPSTGARSRCRSVLQIARPVDPQDCPASKVAFPSDQGRFAAG